ncbi:MAG: hypothetical protein EU529_08765 [Promethearchaeota archaeon]|nr:MAG: hypothetical protein EU529_08765 [Candidatus Lokiarchaeota archaeon]
MVIELSPLVHIEIVVPDAVKAAEFLNRIFGSEIVEKEFSDTLSNMGVVKVVHVKLGNVILQFIEPSSEKIQTLWSEHLDKKGPGVHNLTFIVKDIRAAARALKQEGVKTLIKFPVAWDQFIDPEDLREKSPPVHMIGGEEIVGFRFELAESPYKEDKTPEEYKV